MMGFLLVPDGVISFQRVSLFPNQFPRWSELNIRLCDLNMTINESIEDIEGALQVN